MLFNWEDLWVLQNRRGIYGVSRGAVADSGGVRGVQMHPPLGASNVFWRT